MYKLLGLDIDGTLLNNSNKISEKNKKFISLLNERDVKIVLISGREPSSIRHFNMELNLKNPIVGLNGGIITDHSGDKIFYEKCMDEIDAKKTIELGEKFNMCSMVFIRNSLYVANKKDKRFELFVKHSNSPTEEIGTLSEYLEKNKLWSSINKILLADNNENLLEYRRNLEKETGNKLAMEFSLPFFLEIYDSNVSKGNALIKLGNILNIHKEEMIIVGDGENDITMIDYAGVGVAMGNAPESVKNMADYITLSNDEDGVSHVIQKFWNV